LSAKLVARFTDRVGEYAERVRHRFGLGLDLAGDLFARSLGEMRGLAAHGRAGFS
jgi:hypothetical protein